MRSPRQPAKVMLLCMPMGLVQTPNLALSLLKPALRRAGIDCDVRYFNVELLDRFIPGEEIIRRYVHLVDQPSLAEACASFFADRVFGPDERRASLVEAVLDQASPGERALARAIQAAVDPFLAWCLASIRWSEYRIVGFTSLFAGMTAPSLALAKLLKAHCPELVTVLGGWNTGGDMGRVIAERCGELDYVLRGEAEDTFVDFSRRLLEGKALDGIAGLVFRNRTTNEVNEWPQTLVSDLDTIPEPDFDDYFTAMERSRFRGPPPRGWSLPFESARGCWWGAIRHCKFCGLNGMSMPFRSKSPARVLGELDRMVERHRPRLLFAADTIFDPSYFDSVLPQLEGRYPQVEIAYELKAPIKRRQMAQLKKAGITSLTIGIENLSTRLLQLMEKGTSAVQNVHCLRLASEYGIRVGWQYLYGIPHESLNDYQEALASTPLLHHLSPPLQACPMTLARFSPYFDSAAQHGVAAIHSHRDYQMVYPWPEPDLQRVSYLFDFDFADGRPPGFTQLIATMCNEAAARWQSAHAEVALTLLRGHDLSMIIDTRFGDRRIVLLEGTSALILDALDSPVPTTQIAARAYAHIRDWHNIWFALLGPHQQRDLAVIASMRHNGELDATTITRVGCVFGLHPPHSIEEAESLIAGVVDQLRALSLVFEADGHSVSLAVAAGNVSNTITTPAAFVGEAR